MTPTPQSGWIADAVLLVHAAFVAFIVGGLLLVFLGSIAGWKWVRNPWFRWAHLAGISVVLLQAWMGRLCPLTDIEMALRDRAGQDTYTGSFLSYWVGRMIYYDFPPWIFTLGYTLFAGLVLSAWFRVRPHPLRSREARHDSNAERPA